VDAADAVSGVRCRDLIAHVVLTDVRADHVR
jgi:hypothetical protein